MQHLFVIITKNYKYNIDIIDYSTIREYFNSIII